MSAIRYQPEIDGLRTIAVVPVLLFHLDLPWAANGFMGVDVFFVISGYLISSIVLAEIQSGTFSFRRFWSRRIRRILPLTAVVVAATCVAAACLMFGPARSDVGWQSLASLGSVANIYFWRATGDYWGASAERAPLLHTWSLAVEEQFYVAFPFVAALLFKGPRRTAIIAIGALVVVSASAYFVLSHTRPAASFYLVPTRAWELGIGVLLALVPQETLSSRARRIALPIGLIAVLLSYMSPAALGLSPMFLAVPVLGAALIIAGVGDLPAGRGLLRATLRSRPLIHIGLLSFSLYLWHWPIFVMLRYLNYPIESPGIAIVALAATYLFALGSHGLIEQPLRRARRGVIAALGMIVLAAAGASVLVATSGPPSLLGTRATWLGGIYAMGNRVTSADPGRTFLGVTIGDPPQGAARARISDGIPGGDKEGPERVIVMGDSHAQMWANQVSEACKQLGVKATYWCANGTTPFTSIPPTPGPGAHGLTPAERLEFDTARLAALERMPAGVLVLAARWSTIGNMEMGSGFINHARGLGWRILILKQPPELWFGDLGALEYLADVGWGPGKADLYAEISVRHEAFDEASRALEAICGQDPGCMLMEVADILHDKDGHRAWLASGEVSHYVDDDHLSEEGAALFQDRIQRLMSELLNVPR
jgi:peptidoglycan/LPS O-acetylase OafA/YrhL